MRQLVLVAVAMSLGIAGSAAAGPPRRFGLPQPIQARIIGYLGEKPAAERVETTWRVKCRGKEMVWYVKRIQVLTGDVSYSNIVDDAKPYRLAYMVDGPNDLTQAFAAIPAAQEFATQVVLRLGARHMQLTAVNAAASHD